MLMSRLASCVRLPRLVHHKIQDTRNFILRRFVYINISSIELVSDYSDASLYRASQYRGIGYNAVDLGPRFFGRQGAILSVSS